ncbi:MULTISPECIES: hypothetical protein [Shewanella]|jgi:fumarate reductase subunit C|uniref:Uncharacterized protein n=1 Tax=Shewanella frigidimarina TaxID=56812 RepID=A0A106C0G8_SHEFR|nr:MULTISPECIES: hypothetical protein [Shewanella]MBB1380592.1 hypothetical protein [Shewanella sp. SR41-2]KVX01994.1 hypothetical protein AWJ07_05325 [Shewanella frigidimarina]MBB1360900.1 hypothetical protein [Shewanella sp. SR44-4]MBB1426171.1 hypothetical protein [Shewanella sp. SG44-2]MBO1897184.1 hypothetical protein [Shewanella sp. BF02_Schw]|tara:strand:- start:747 stop:1010 length:264 start_codon:yes stop_codon:yes gene_type:complete
MTQENTQITLASIHRSMLLVALIDFPGTILFGLGLYGILVGFDQDFLPMLANPLIIIIMLIIGAIIMLWGIIRMMLLARQKQGILQQ